VVEPTGPEPWEKIAVFAFSVVFVVALLVLAIFFPTPTTFQYEVFKIVLALAAGGVALIIPGFLHLRVPFLRAGGPLAVFGVTYFFSPATLVIETTFEPEPAGLDLGFLQEKAPILWSLEGLSAIAWRVADQPSSFSAAPGSGVVAPNSSSLIEVRLSRAGKEPGSIDGQIQLAYTAAGEKDPRHVSLGAKVLVLGKLEYRFGSVDDKAQIVVNRSASTETDGSTG